MSTHLRKGLVVAAIHLALVASVGAKLLIDRATRPRIWARTAPVDPDLPIRGRYVQLRIEGVPGNVPDAEQASPVVLTAEGGRLTFNTDARGWRRGLTARTVTRDGVRVARLDRTLAYFIPEHVPDPSIRDPGEELWVEVTIPKSGPPRPIRLGVRRNGELTPLD